MRIREGPIRLYAEPHALLRSASAALLHHESVGINSRTQNRDRGQSAYLRVDNRSPKHFEVCRQVKKRLADAPVARTSSIRQHPYFLFRPMQFFEGLR